MSSENTIWKDSRATALAEVLTLIEDQVVMQNFLRDVLTEKEIIEIGSRYKAAQMLAQGKTYASIVETTKLSSRTVARISEWLQSGTRGYDSAIKIQEQYHEHTQPAHAD
jgi:TrpR-related protein YerC/YecD